jgi:hypothetical protein
MYGRFISRSKPARNKRTRGGFGRSEGSTIVDQKSGDPSKKAIVRHRYQLAVTALLPVALHSGALTQTSSRNVTARVDAYQIQALSHGTPDHDAPISLFKVGEKKRKPATTSSDEITVVLGPEYDQLLRRVVQEVIVRLGVDCIRTTGV